MRRRPWVAPPGSAGAVRGQAGPPAPRRPRAPRQGGQLAGRRGRVGRERFTRQLVGEGRRQGFGEFTDRDGQQRAVSGGPLVPGQRGPQAGRVRMARIVGRQQRQHPPPAVQRPVQRLFGTGRAETVQGGGAARRGEFGGRPLGPQPVGRGVAEGQRWRLGRREGKRPDELAQVQPRQPGQPGPPGRERDPVGQHVEHPVVLRPRRLLRQQLGEPDPQVAFAHGRFAVLEFGHRPGQRARHRAPEHRDECPGVPAGLRAERGHPGVEGGPLLAAVAAGEVAG